MKTSSLLSIALCVMSAGIFVLPPRPGLAAGCRTCATSGECGCLIEGVCIPNRLSYGFFETKWRRWPGQIPGAAAAPEPDGRVLEDIPPGDVPDVLDEANTSDRQSRDSFGLSEEAPPALPEDFGGQMPRGDEAAPSTTRPPVGSDIGRPSNDAFDMAPDADSRSPFGSDLFLDPGGADVNELPAIGQPGTNDSTDSSSDSNERLVSFQLDGSHRAKHFATASSADNVPMGSGERATVSLVTSSVGAAKTMRVEAVPARAAPQRAPTAVPNAQGERDGNPLRDAIRAEFVSSAAITQSDVDNPLRRQESDRPAAQAATPRPPQAKQHNRPPSRMPIYRRATGSQPIVNPLRSR